MSVTKPSSKANASLLGSSQLGLDSSQEVKKILSSQGGKFADLGGQVRTMTLAAFWLALSDRLQAHRDKKPIIEWLFHVFTVRMGVHSAVLIGPEGALCSSGGDIKDTSTAETLDLVTNQKGAWTIKYAGAKWDDLSAQEKKWISEVQQALKNIIL